MELTKEESFLTEIARDFQVADYPFPVPAEGGSNRYCRYLLQKTPEFELYCIVWNEGAVTPFHGHPDGGCWMRVVEGELVETTMRGDRVMRVGDGGFQKGPYGIHRIVARQPSRSLHLYKPAALVL